MAAQDSFDYMLGIGILTLILGISKGIVVATAGVFLFYLSRVFMGIDVYDVRFPVGYFGGVHVSCNSKFYK